MFIGRCRPSSLACVVVDANNAPSELVFDSLLFVALSVSFFRSDLDVVQTQKNYLTYLLIGLHHIRLRCRNSGGALPVKLSSIYS